MADIVEVTQLGRLTKDGKGLQVGSFVYAVDDDGKRYAVIDKKTARPKVAFAKQAVPFGDGLELIDHAGFQVRLTMTAAAAKRLGWPHPENLAERTKRDLHLARAKIGNWNYGEQEQLAAMREVEELERLLDTPQRTVRPDYLVGL